MSTPTKERYVMEGNEGELQRLADHHTIIKSYMGTLALAPVDFSQPRLRILDSGTADGLWLRELQDSIPTPHEYVGTDITEAFFPPDPRPGLRLFVQSITKPWPADWIGTFDYVHQRLTMVGVGPNSIPDTVSSLVRLVKPGGWFEVVEADFSGDLHNGPATVRFERLMETFLDTLGVGFRFATGLRAHLENAGLEQVQDQVFVIEYGAACEDPELGALGISQLLSAARGMLEFMRSTAVQSVTNVDEEVPETFMSDFQKELEDRGCRFKVIGLWGRRPFATET